MWSLWHITGRLFRPLFWLQQQIEIEYFSFQPPGFAWMWIITVTFCNNCSERIGYFAQMPRDKTPMSEMPLNFVYSAFGCRCLCDINQWNISLHQFPLTILRALMGQKCGMLRHPFFARVMLVMLDWEAYLLWWWCVYLILLSAIDPLILFTVMFICHWKANKTQCHPIIFTQTSIRRLVLCVADHARVKQLRMHMM